ncbi:MAG: TIGR01777 family protein [Acidimicrobiia bacterium]|nr:TIGR01777 family protein [Acidimicrobiia bacterium]
MRIVIGGASGFLGSALVDRLEQRGDDVIRLVRREVTDPNESQWDPATRQVDSAVLEGADAVINLGGVGIGDRRWDDEHKQAVLQSRLDATSTLAAAVVGLSSKPGIFVSASAIGFYGDRDDETLTEESGAGPEDDFLVEVVKAWEEAALPIVDAGVPLAFLRTGIVLGDGGVLGRMLLPFKLGVGGKMGSGKQWWSWISLEDQVRATLHIVDNRLSGAFNLTAPNPARQVDFAKSLAGALGRPAFVPTPAFALNAILGAERAQALVFTSARVLPQSLRASGFEFIHPTLSEAWPSVLDA